MNKLKIIFKKWRVILLFIVLLLAVIAINPNPWQTGVAIRGVVRNSSADNAEIPNPAPSVAPRSREVIISMNNKPISSESDYYDFINTLKPNQTVQIKTNKDTYKLTVIPKIKVIDLNETETKTIEEVTEVNESVNGTYMLVNKTVQKQVEIPKIKTEIVGVEDIGLSIYAAPATNIRKGLDLQGGTRVLLEPEGEVSESDMELTIENIKERLNVYGLSDVVVKKTKDYLSGKSFILVEIAGANEEEVKDLIAKQGKFEAKIGNNTAFRGGGDITYVCRAAPCAGVDPTSCGKYEEGYGCRFGFTLTLSPEAAQRQANLTKDLDVITEGNEAYLSEKLDLYLDNSLVDSLNIVDKLRGVAITEPQITGSGTGNSIDEAKLDALNNMKRLQTILITGSLPVKLDIARTDGVSPVLGSEFVKNAIIIALLAMVAVALVVFIRYRKWEVSAPVLLTMSSEILILLGFAALVRWNLDIAAIAGIIVAAGTGVDDQVVIADEALRGETDVTYNWKQKLKKAFFIIWGAYATTMFAMIPLLFAGAGLIKGFAFTTMVGVTVGVFITRPAFAAVIEVLLRK